MAPVNAMDAAIGGWLDRRARRDGAAPLLTYYRPERGERLDLGATTVANWADKTVHLLADLGLTPGTDIALPVMSDHPGHWMAQVWPWACWQAGLGVRCCSAADADGADLAVIGPDTPAPAAADVVVCSLDVWGRPAAQVPAGALDYAGSVLGFPDAHVSEPAQPTQPAWSDGERNLTFADLAALPPDAGRTLVRAVEPWATVAAFLSVVHGGGSLVVVDGPAADAEIDRIAAAEGARVAAS